MEGPVPPLPPASSTRRWPAPVLRAPPDYERRVADPKTLAWQPRSTSRGRCRTRRWEEALTTKEGKHPIVVHAVLRSRATRQGGGGAPGARGPAGAPGAPGSREASGSPATRASTRWSGRSALRATGRSRARCAGTPAASSTVRPLDGERQGLTRPDQTRPGVRPGRNGQRGSGERGRRGVEGPAAPCNLCGRSAGDWAAPGSRAVAAIVPHGVGCGRGRKSLFEDGTFQRFDVRRIGLQYFLLASFALVAMSSRTAFASPSFPRHADVALDGVADRQPPTTVRVTGYSWAPRRAV